jgi:cystathionine beta-lyase/cystathionine gamma-synthase
MARSASLPRRVGGVVTVRDANLLAALRQSRELTGATSGNLEAFLAVRGARTLALRLERAQHNAINRYTWQNGQSSGAPPFFIVRP